MTFRRKLALTALLLTALPLSVLAAPPKAKPAAAPKPKADAPDTKPDARDTQGDAPGPQDRPSKPKAVQPVPVPPGAKGMAVGFGANGHFVAARPKGGLEASGKSAEAATAFELLDLNGGALQTGDKVQIALAGAGRSSFWQENKGKVTRTGSSPDAACAFVVKWVKKDTSLTLQTASKQYVSVPASGGALVTTAKASDPTAVLTVIKKK